MSLKGATLLACLLAVLILGLSSSAFGYLKMAEPPDVDKQFVNLTCWLATAANMLAGAGYGYSSPDTSSVQARAEHIYSELVDHFGDDV